MTQVKVQLEGMMCGMCESHVKDAIRKGIPEAKDVTASHSTNIASFFLENDLPRTMIQHELKTAIAPTGYKILSVEVQAGVPYERKKKVFSFGKR